MKIKSWFVNKNFSSDERIAIGTSDGFTIERETEKAFLFKWQTKYGSISKWIPKSCCAE